ncbi:hypothetical protein LPJ66_011811 [Kickxella alabastrina]|uniref:Uncharacterized protein n=1 Tax=Kickxella alabastrina TaxID=61397 RepID=A0ACC1HWL9_9FUNG|nr:hypothetical protein LPJ66_011811 [Kickxella alabastrina]
MPATCEQTLRDLDSIIQHWNSTHQKSTQAASTLGDLHNQSTKVQAQAQAHNDSNNSNNGRNGKSIQNQHALLLSMLETQKHQLIQDLRQHIHQYAQAIQQLDSLCSSLEFTSSNDVLAAEIAGINEEFTEDSVRRCRQEYVREYSERREALDRLVWGGGDVDAFVDQWTVSRVDLGAEEEYLDRLRVLRLARQWQANEEAEKAIAF